MYSDWVDACDAVAKDTVGKDEDNDIRGMSARDSPRPADEVGPDELTGRDVTDSHLY